MKRTILALAIALSSIMIAPAATATSGTIGVAYDTGGRGDRSFNDAAAAGLTRAQKQISFSLAAVVTDGTAQDRELRLRSLIAKNCDLIIAIGAGYAPQIKSLSLEFPNSQFAIINDASVDALNVTSIIFAAKQGAFLAGYAAALTTKTGKVAMIAYPSDLDLYQSGFLAGVKASKKGVAASIRYAVSSYGPLTKALIDAGNDAIYVAISGSGAEILAAVVAANSAKIKRKSFSEVGIIITEPDQYLSVTPTSNKYVIASVVKRVDKAIYDLITQEMSNTRLLDVLDGKVGIYGYRYDVTDGGVELNARSKALLAQSVAIGAGISLAKKIDG